MPLQELFVLNSEFMAANAQALAARLLAAAGPAATDAERIGLAYRLLFGRAPTEHELALGLSYVSASPASSAGRSDWQRYTQALLATNEFLFVD